MIGTSRITQRHREFEKGKNQPQIHRNLINPRVPDKEDAVFEYWERMRMTSSGDKLI